MNTRPSGRVLIDENGKTEIVGVDETPGADNSRAHAYDLAPGQRFNRIARMTKAEKDKYLKKEADREHSDAAIASSGDAA
jgi:hypothetical protein